MSLINFEYSIDNNIDLEFLEKKAMRAYTDLHLKQMGKMTGWLEVEKVIKDVEMKTLKKYAKEVRENADVLIVIGIGGSYLGGKAGIDFLSDYYNFDNSLEVIFVGNNLSEKYITDTIKYIENKNVYINVISKSGSTMEPMIAFRIFKKFLEEKYKEQANKKIIITTTKGKGKLYKIAKENNYKLLYIPENIGGRYSVLTTVGMFPIACRGFNIEKIIDGAKEEKEELFELNFKKNFALQYAALREYIYNVGKDIEVFSSFTPNMKYFLEWLKQLFGESECKNSRGIFPASLIYSTDLHSLGQLIQEGKRNIFETFINVKKERIKNSLYIEKVENDIDELNYIAKYSINEINNIAKAGTKKAHIDGQVPVFDITIEKQDEKTLGAIFYFFQYACAIYCYIAGVNAFNQPGVEKYKNEIKRILEKVN